MKTKKSFLWLAFLILATIWILVRHNQQVGYYSVKGLVFGTVYKITYQHDGDLKPEIEAELKRFDQSLSPFNDSSVISRVNRNEELVTDSFFQKCFHRSMEISRETKELHIPSLLFFYGSYARPRLCHILIQKESLIVRL